MTIEYTPAPYIRAKVIGTNGYTIYTADEDTIHQPGGTLFKREVPEHCEAMMKLAGHEPFRGGPGCVASLEAEARKAVAKRIIARLDDLLRDGVAPLYISKANALSITIGIVRDECGL